MVVPRKPSTSSLPAAASRSNSSQPIPKVAKNKEKSSLSDSNSINSKSSSSTPPRSTLFSLFGSKKSTPTVNKHSKKKNAKKSKAKHSPSIIDRLSYYFLTLLVVYTLTVCPRDTSLTNPVCRSLQNYRSNILEPYILPPIKHAFQHPAVQPYVAKAHHVQATVTPYIVTATNRAEPYVRKAISVVWDGILVPVYRKHVVPRFYQHVYPHLHKFYLGKIDPYIGPVHRKTTQFYSQTSLRIHHAYLTTKPHVQRAVDATRPHAEKLYDASKPHVLRAYEAARKWAAHAYEVSKPHVKLAYRRLALRAKLATRQLMTYRRLYVDKHVWKIWEKVLELSGTAAVTGTTTRSATGVKTDTHETKAAPVVGSTSFSSNKVRAVSVTPSEDPSSSSVASPEEPVATSTASSSSTVSASTVKAATATLSSVSSVLSETLVGSPSSFLEDLSASASSVSASIVPAPTPIEEIPVAPLSSASSIIEETLVASPSSILSQLSASASSISESVLSSSTSSPSAASTIADSLAPSSISAPSEPSSLVSLVSEIKASASSAASSSSAVVPAASASGVSSAEDPVPEDLADEDFDDLLSELGLGDAEDPADPSPAPSEDVSEETLPETTLTPEEIAAEKAKKTARVRADILERHDGWFDKMEETSKRLGVEVRTELRIVRQAAAAALVGKDVVGAGEVQGEYQISEDDEKTMTHIEGEKVSTLIDNLAGEGERLVRGLEGYLKKEGKSPPSASGDALRRKEKWAKVAEKVEEKFYGTVQDVRGKVHRWYIAVRDIEIRDCLAASTEVRRLAEAAQANLGLDYAWLEDVTFDDWQRYHDLMRVYERFDEQIRQIQNGTHRNPVEDPLPLALNNLQQEMEDVVTGFQGRVRSLNTKAVTEVFALPVEPKSESTSDSESEAADPEVSILPIDPKPISVPGSEGEFDASSILLGKSKEQVEEALKGVPLVHEEL